MRTTTTVSTALTSSQLSRPFCAQPSPRRPEALPLSEDGPTRRRFLARVQGEISKRGTIDVLRHGIRHNAHELDLFYGTPSAGNVQAKERFEQNRFTVTRQLRYSRDETQRALDIGLFINGLPVFTFELKNSLTKQTVRRRHRAVQEETETPARSSSSSAGASRTSRWTRTTCASARTSRARHRGSCPSTAAGTTARATRPTPTGSRPTTCGARC